jgi:predicted nucleotidyltransferase
MRAVRTVAIIGSYATGTPTSSSDIDVLVLVGGMEMPTYRVFAICAELGILLDCEVNALIYSTREFAQRLRERDPQARHMARGALLVKGVLPPGAPQRRLRRAPPTRDGIIPLGRSVSDRKIANLLETSDLLLRDSRHLTLSDLGRTDTALEAVRHLVNAILEAEGYRLKGEDIDGAALQRAQAATGMSRLDRLHEAYLDHARRNLWQITPEARERTLMEAREFCEGARAWLVARRPTVGGNPLI